MNDLASGSACLPTGICKNSQFNAWCLDVLVDALIITIFQGYSLFHESWLVGFLLEKKVALYLSACHLYFPDLFVLYQFGGFHQGFA